jgi:thymidylate kinase
MTYLSEKEDIISYLTSNGCSLLRDDNDIDFGLLDDTKRDSIYHDMLKMGFICTNIEDMKLNFKKFIESKLLDIDVDTQVNSSFLKQLFFDIKIDNVFELAYLQTPEKYQVAMKSVRYLLLLRGGIKKYSDFFYQHQDEIYKNNFFLKYLTKNPFRRDIDFTTFMKIVKMDKVSLIKNLKFKYILYFGWLKVKYLFFKRRGKIISIEGVDGAGKSTIIEILAKELQKPTFYMGERGFRFDTFYSRPKSIFLKPFAYLMRNSEKLYRYMIVYKASKSHSVVFTDRYHRFSKTAHNYKFLQYLDKIFFFFYPRADISIVLWNSTDVILSRKQEVSKRYIEEFNQNKEQDFPNAHFIKNDDIDTTLNSILRVIYA